MSNGIDVREPSAMHPEIVVKLDGDSGNFLVLVGRVRQALMDAGHVDDAKGFLHTAFDCKTFDALLYLARCNVTIN